MSPGKFPRQDFCNDVCFCKLLFAEINASTALRIWRNCSLNYKGMIQEFIEKKINSLLCNFSPDR